MRTHGRIPPGGRDSSYRVPGMPDPCTSGRRNNERIQATPPISRVRVAERAPSGIEEAAGARIPVGALRALGALGLVGVLTSVFLLTADAATGPSQYVPARSGGWPNWLAGPFAGIGVGITPDRFQTLTLIMAVSYLAVLLAAHTLSGRALALTILAANLVLLLGPPLISQDVFGYLGFARLGALHGLDPYTHVAAQVPTDPIYTFVGWPFQHSPYGSLFTLASYAIVPLGLAGGLWALKAIAVAASLGAVALVARAAADQELSENPSARVPATSEEEARGFRIVLKGHSPRFAAAFVGLNPVLLVLAVGGAHNDMLLLLALAGALLLTASANSGRAGSHPRGAAAALVAGMGIKVTAGLALPFLMLAPRDTRERLRVVLAAGLSLALLAALGLIGFGSHALGFISAVSEQQQLVATHSIPAETARLVGLHGTPSWWRHSFIAAFAVVLACALWRTLRGADWRVAAGWTTLALLLSTAWLLPWYAIWPLPLAAVSGDRRLRAATLIFCAYALLIHLPLASPLLSPESAVHKRHVVHAGSGVRPLAAGRDGVEARHSVDLTRLEVSHHSTLDLRG